MNVLGKMHELVLTHLWVAKVSVDVPSEANLVRVVFHRNGGYAVSWCNIQGSQNNSHRKISDGSAGDSNLFDIAVHTRTALPLKPTCCIWGTEDLCLEGRPKPRAVALKVHQKMPAHPSQPQSKQWQFALAASLRVHVSRIRPGNRLHPWYKASDIPAGDFKPPGTKVLWNRFELVTTWWCTRSGCKQSPANMHGTCSDGPTSPASLSGSRISSRRVHIDDFKVMYFPSWVRIRHAVKGTVLLPQGSDSQSTQSGPQRILRFSTGQVGHLTDICKGGRSEHYARVLGHHARVLLVCGVCGSGRVVPEDSYESQTLCKLRIALSNGQ